MKTIYPLIGAIVLALPAGAQTKPPAPEYYLDTVIAMSLAEQYAWHCPKVEVDGDAIGVLYGAVVEKLVAAGFDAKDPHLQMDLPPAAETDKVIHDMLALHENKPDAQSSFCAGAAQERADKTITGQMLRDAS